MARCNACFSITTKSDLKCYVCGEPVPDAPGRFKQFLTRFWAKPEKSAPKRKKAKSGKSTDAILHRTEDASVS
jgi:hypothetical protein